MIEKFDDLNLADEDSFEQVDEKIKEKLGVSFIELKQALTDYVVSHAEELTHELTNIAPLGNYEKLLEDNDSMAEFIKNEASKAEHWHVQGVTVSGPQNNLLAFHFGNDSIDDGDVFEGFVYVSFSGKIRHAFAQGSDN